MKILSIDPSFSKTGLAYIDTYSKTILFKYVSPKGTNETYLDKVTRAKHIATYITDIVDTPTAVIFEEPLVTSMMASALGILSGVLVTYLDKLENIKQIYTINPNIVNSVNKNIRGRTKTNRKQISLQKAHDLLMVFKQLGYTVTIHNDKLTKKGIPRERKLSPDEAEAFIMAIIYIIYIKALPKEQLYLLKSMHQGLKKDLQVNLFKNERT